MASFDEEKACELLRKKHPENEVISSEELNQYANSNIPYEDVIGALSTNISNGLTSDEVIRRLHLYGTNELTKPKRIPLWLLFLSQFVNIVIIILMIAAIVSILVGELVEGIAVFIIILITATVATYTEYSSGNALEALASLTDPHSHVYRNGQLEMISTCDIVPGDIIVLSPGDLVPADIRIIESHHVKVNEMILTGESAEVKKSAHTTVEENENKLTAVNMVYGSTSMVDGKLTGVVLLTGMNTRVGSIATLLNQGPENDSSENKVPQEMQSRIHRFNSEIQENRSSESEEYESDEERDDHKKTEKKTSSFSVSYVVNATKCCTSIKKFMSSVQPKRTPLQDEIHHLGLIMTGFAITGAVLVIIIGILRNFRDPNNEDNPPWLQSLMLAVSMAVSAIPEGLPLVVVMCLALGTHAMSERNVLIRRLPAVETLGSASVVCSDKTGTLTTGKMTATQMWTYERLYSISGSGYDPTQGHVMDSKDNQVTKQSHSHDVALAATMGIINLCNDSDIRYNEGKWVPIGTSTEAALVVASQKFGIATGEYRKSNPQECVVPFSSKFKMMASVHRLQETDSNIFIPAPNSSSDKANDQNNLVVMSKGAPLVLLNKCKYVIRDEHDGSGPVVTELTADMRSDIVKECDRLSDLGLRVLAACYRRSTTIAVDEDDESVPTEDKLDVLVSNMVFSGLIGMMDPPRPGVKKAVLRAKEGGVRTVMITGDYLKTAVAIAKMINIVGPTMDETECAVDCSVLRPNGDYLSAREIDEITWHTFVFARARPEDKIQIVKSFQRQGKVCGMTGDGVNDAPALRQANIGIAMGIAGSEVAKAASDMILTDDKFSSIVGAIEMGRTIYSNLRKFVMYFIGTNWSQVLVILLSLLIGMPNPLEPLQILFINLITDGMPAVALSIEDPEGDVMRQPPRKKNSRILSGVIAVGILGHATVLVVFMLLTFFMGLWWNIGVVLIDNMYNDDGDLITQCNQLTSSGTWVEVESGDCVKDGLKIARTMVFLIITFAECLRPLTARSFSLAIHNDPFRNTAMIKAILFSMSCTFIVVFVPVVQDIFHLTAPRWFEWLIIIVGVILTVVSDEMLKSKLRSENLKNRRWEQLFGDINNITMELRNVRSHVNRIEYAAVPNGDAGDV